MERVSPLTSPLRVLTWGNLAWVVGVLTSSVAAMVLLHEYPLLDAVAYWGILSLGSATFWPVELRLGVDGFYVPERLPWNRRYVAWKRVDRLEKLPGRFGNAKVKVHLDDGSAVTLQVKKKDRDALYDAMVVALREHNTKEPAEAPPALVGEIGGESCREGAVTRELLVRVLEDPHADLDLRVRAAERVRAMDDAPEVEALREASVDPKLVKALEKL